MYNSNKIIAAAIMLLCMIGVSCNSSPGSEDCRQYKTGKFKIRNDENGTVTLLRRTMARQIEVKEGETDTLIMAVRWINDCEYELNYLTGIPDSMVDFARSHPIKVQILKTGKDYYTYNSSFKGLDFELKDSAHRAE